MSNKWGIKPKQAEVLVELEIEIKKLTGRWIPLVNEIKGITPGVKAKEDNIIGLGLYGCKLTSLPESITNLASLQELDLSNNQFTSLPEPITNLKSLQRLDLSFNKLTTLPVSLWKLNNLEFIRLEGNKWEGEWKELAKKGVHTIREFCLKRATINIFISHTVKEFSSYKIKELAEFLEQQPEINQVYFCEEDLKGNIDTWMEETIPKSQLLLFIGTQQSILSKDCNEELRLARVNKIPRIPIRGLDLSWQELANVGLSRELGFDFDEKKFPKLCENLYTYICEFKRKRDLFGKEKDKS